MPDRPDLPRKPSRAETARTNGARSRGPVTADGKARSSRNALAHGLRARSLTPVPALGESQPVLDAHLAAYRREFSAPGPYARDLAEAIACANLRAARAERLEAQFLTELIANGESLAGPDARRPRLILRYRREAELSAKRARQELEALAKARAAGLLPDEDEAAAAEAELDAALAELPCPNEPKVEKAEPAQALTATPAPANDDAGTGEPEPEPSHHPPPAPPRAGPAAAARLAADLRPLPPRGAGRLLPRPVAGRAAAGAGGAGRAGGQGRGAGRGAPALAAAGGRRDRRGLADVAAPTPRRLP